MCTLGLDSMHLDKEMASVEPRPSIPWPLIALVWTVVVFLGGTFFSVGMGWGRSSDSIDNMNREMTRLESTITHLETLIDRLNEDYAAARVKLGQVDEHLHNDDQRLDRLEGIKH